MWFAHIIPCHGNAPEFRVTDSRTRPFVGREAAAARPEARPEAGPKVGPEPPPGQRVCGDSAPVQFSRPSRLRFQPLTYTASHRFACPRVGPATARVLHRLAHWSLRYQAQAAIHDPSQFVEPDTILNNTFLSSQFQQVPVNFPHSNSNWTQAAQERTAGTVSAAFIES
jgi:hypothetical protein